MSGENLIEIKGLSKHYAQDGRSYAVLEDLDFRLRTGESACILGASGAGKTTLLEMIGLLSRPTSGNHRFLGSDVARFSDRQLTLYRRNHIGFVFQAFHLLPHLTVLDNVCLPGRYAHAKRVREKACALLEEVDLTHRLRHRPNHLSGGEQQRVAIARALMNEPRLILADEPTGNLDPGLSGLIVDLLLRQRSEGTSIVVVTHNAGISDRFSRRVLLDGGKLSDVA